MTRAVINPVPLTATGYNLTDSAGFTAMTLGANNGVEIAYDAATLIVLKNTTGGVAVYTVKIPTPAQYTAIGITLSDITVTVAAAKMWLLKPHASMVQTAVGRIYIDCDVAGSILVLV